MSSLVKIFEDLSKIGVTEYELSFSNIASAQFCQEYWMIPYVLIGCYLAFLYFGTKYMADKKPFELQVPLALWNLLLSIFSFCGMCRTVPFLVSFVLSNPYYTTVCDGTSHRHGHTGLWIALFAFSKVPELVDTVFVVLRKKPLLFLHWYHHITVLAYCWVSFGADVSTGLYFVAMNYTVHAVMYGYYFLQAAKMCPKWFPAVIITVGQILQMVVGTGVCISTWYYVFVLKADCGVSVGNLIVAALMYGSYLILFAQFFLNRYGGKKEKSKKLH